MAETAMAEPARIEIATCPGNSFFFVVLVADLGVGGEVGRQMVWQGRSYEAAILMGETMARKARLPVVDRVVE
ncbi:hypothetical protein [Paracoccus sp. TOH]|uniref:hypothetical protein n=1 Tax=Paracoccus sp. TOH TaxID=1263728 RepID=UPI0025B141B9|nr:hypothetical protein [Paracoccus sp. TOH]WJS83554.1 hypothetical protein NBE95_07155 [Paracoccus sp. TOH]